MKTKNEIIRRSVCLLCYVDRCALEDTIFDGVKRSLEERENQRRIIIKWLKEKDYYNYLTQKEKEIIEIPVINKTNKDILNMHSDYECIEPLLWSLGLIDKLNNYDNYVLDNLHTPLKIGSKHTLEKLSEQCKCVSKEEVKKHCEIAMLWYWRSLESRNNTSKITNYADSIKQIFGEDYINLLYDYEYFDMHRCDFLVKGKLFSKLNDLEKAIIEVISEKRFYAFEWLCSNDDWDNIDLIS